MFFGFSPFSKADEELILELLGRKFYGGATGVERSKSAAENNGSHMILLVILLEYDMNIRIPLSKCHSSIFDPSIICI